MLAPLWDGSDVTLRWNRSAEADRYEVRIYSSSLVELAVPAKKDTAVTIPLATLLEEADSSGGIFYRVIATRYGDVIAISKAELLGH